MRLIFGLSFLVLFACTSHDPVSTEASQMPESNLSDLHAFDQLAKVGTNPLVRVMTRNIYIGADVDVVLSAQDPTQIPVLAAQAFQELISTNFPERAIALAKEIAITKPDLIGLQEVNIIRLQSPGDAVYGGTTPAETVLMDYLEIFMATLEAMGLDYKVAGVIQNVDVEIPMITGVNPNTFDDVRVTDHDVVLVRGDVEVSNVQTENFKINLMIPSLNTEIKRGYVALDVMLNGHSYHFVNTHLEPFLLDVKIAQAQELLASVANETLPVIMVGDFNTPAPLGEVYQYILSEGFLDVWTLNASEDNPEGFTYGHDSDLRNMEANFWERIDQIYIKDNSIYPTSPLLDPVLAIVIGDEEFNRTPSGLWPSDHGGVVARLKFRHEKPFRVVLSLQ